MRRGWINSFVTFGVVGAVLSLAGARSQTPAPNDPRMNVSVPRGSSSSSTSTAHAPIAPEPAVSRGSWIGSLAQDSPDLVITEFPGITQSSNSVFADPKDPYRVLNSNTATSGQPATNFLGAGAFNGSGGGGRWFGDFVMANGENLGDPSAVIDRGARMYVAASSDAQGVEVSYSEDPSVLWTTRTVAPKPGPDPGDFCDKNHLWVDNSPSSSFAGNLYCGWTPFTCTSFSCSPGPSDRQIVVKGSIDRGDTWQPQITISAGVNAGSHNQGVRFHTGPLGEVYAVWSIYDSFPLFGPTPEHAIGFAKSTNGGASWQTAKRIITDIRGIRNFVTSKNHRRNSFPSIAVDNSCGPNRGRIYVVWSNIGVPGDNVGPDIDLYMISSSNGGATWSAPTRVNQDTNGLGKEHYFPWIACDPSSGALSVISYDDRDVPATDVEVFVAVSTDGGTSWKDFPVSDTSFTPAPIVGPAVAPNYFGDYLGISAREGRVYPVWTGNPSGRALAYCSPFTLPNRTLQVPTPQFPTIQSAVNAACEGNVVQLAAQTFQGAGNRDIRCTGKTVTVRGAGPGLTTIDGQDLSSAFYIIGGAGTIGIEDLRIINGKPIDPGFPWGGGIHCANTNLRIKNCIIEDCEAGRFGAGLYFDTSWPNASLTVENCIVRDNTTTDATFGSGAGMWIWATRSIQVYIRNSFITGNTTTATLAAGGGAGIHLTFPALGPPEPLSSCVALIEGCTIADNSSAAPGSAGGGVSTGHNDNSVGHTFIKDSILWGNDATLGAQLAVGNGGCAIVYTALQDGLPGVYVAPDGSLGNGTGVIDANPQFQNPPVNYHLRKFSPCINAGNPGFVPVFAETDIDGGARVLEGRIDMGADERLYGFVQQAPPP